MERHEISLTPQCLLMIHYKCYEFVLFWVPHETMGNSFLFCLFCSIDWLHASCRAKDDLELPIASLPHRDAEIEGTLLSLIMEY